MPPYGLEYEHRPWSTFGDAEKIAAYSPQPAFQATAQPFTPPR